MNRRIAQAQRHHLEWKNAALYEHDSHISSRILECQTHSKEWLQFRSTSDHCQTHVKLFSRAEPLRSGCTTDFLQAITQLTMPPFLRTLDRRAQAQIGLGKADHTSGDCYESRKDQNLGDPMRSGPSGALTDRPSSGTGGVCHKSTLASTLASPEEGNSSTPCR